MVVEILFYFELWSCLNVNIVEVKNKKDRNDSRNMDCKRVQATCS